MTIINLQTKKQRDKARIELLEKEKKWLNEQLTESAGIIRRFVVDTEALEITIKGMTEVTFSQRVKMEDLQKQVKRTRKYADEFSDDSANLRLTNSVLENENKALREGGQAWKEKCRVWDLERQERDKEAAALNLKSHKDKDAEIKELKEWKESVTFDGRHCP